MNQRTTSAGTIGRRNKQRKAESKCFASVAGNGFFNERSHHIPHLRPGMMKLSLWSNWIRQLFSKEYDGGSIPSRLAKFLLLIPYCLWIIIVTVLALPWLATMWAKEKLGVEE